MPDSDEGNEKQRTIEVVNRNTRKAKALIARIQEFTKQHKSDAEPYKALVQDVEAFSARIAIYEGGADDAAFQKVWEADSLAKLHGEQSAAQKRTLIMKTFETHYTSTLARRIDDLNILFMRTHLALGKDQLAQGKEVLLLEGIYVRKERGGFLVRFDTNVWESTKQPLGQRPQAFYGTHIHVGYVKRPRILFIKKEVTRVEDLGPEDVSGLISQQAEEGVDEYGMPKLHFNHGHDYTPEWIPKQKRRMDVTRELHPNGKTKYVRITYWYDRAKDQKGYFTVYPNGAVAEFRTGKWERVEQNEKLPGLIMDVVEIEKRNNQ